MGVLGKGTGSPEGWTKFGSAQGSLHMKRMIYTALDLNLDIGVKFMTPAHQKMDCHCHLRVLEVVSIGQAQLKSGDKDEYRSLQIKSEI